MVDGKEVGLNVPTSLRKGLELSELLLEMRLHLEIRLHLIEL